MLLRRRRRRSAPHRIHGRAVIRLFGGKGGVGKTTCCAAHGVQLADSGHRTLLVSTDPAHSLGDLLEHRLGDTIREVSRNLWACELDPDRAAHRYLQEVKSNIRELAPPELVAEATRQVDIALSAPGTMEAALFERLVAVLLENHEHFDYLLFDTAPTGHTLHLLTLPETMQAWVQSLLLRRRRTMAFWHGEDRRAAEDRAAMLLQARQQRFTAARGLLMDPNICAFFLIMNADRLSMLETDRALAHLRAHKVPIGGVIINRLTPTGEDPFLRQRQATEAHYVEAARSRFADLPCLCVPAVAAEIRGLEGLAAIGARLAQAGLGRGISAQPVDQPEDHGG